MEIAGHNLQQKLFDSRVEYLQSTGNGEAIVLPIRASSDCIITCVAQFVKHNTNSMYFGGAMATW